MKKGVKIIFFTILFSLFTIHFTAAQCSICTRTAQQMGEKPAQGMNSGILYLAFAPIAIAGYIGFKWWKGNKDA